MQQIGKTQEDDLNPVNMSFTCYQDNISEVEQVSSEYEWYVPTETEDSFEMFPNNNLEWKEVDVTTAAQIVMDTLDVSEDDNYLSCTKDVAEISQNGDGRVNPKEFMPVLSIEFERLCPVSIDGDTLERCITDHFLSILNDFKRCDITHLQNIYAQVEQNFCIEAILTTIDAIRNRFHIARDHE